MCPGGVVRVLQSLQGACCSARTAIAYSSGRSCSRGKGTVAHGPGSGGRAGGLCIGKCYPNSSSKANSSSMGTGKGKCCRICRGCHAMPGTISVSERGKVAGVQDDHPMHRFRAICTGNMGSLDRICRKMKKVCRAETPTKQGVFEHIAPCRAKIIWARWAR